MIDECHVLWGNILGYVWGKTSERIEVPITNEQKRTTFDEALNFQERRFYVQEYESGNTKNTVKFLQYLQLAYCEEHWQQGYNFKTAPERELSGRLRTPDNSFRTQDDRFLVPQINPGLNTKP